MSALAPRRARTLRNRPARTIVREPHVGEEQGAWWRTGEMRYQREMVMSHRMGRGADQPSVVRSSKQVPAPMATTAATIWLEVRPDTSRPMAVSRLPGAGAEKAAVDRSPVGLAVDTQDDRIAARLARASAAGSSDRR